MTNPIDWSHVQSFVAVAQSGSLTAAARQQNTSQPTMGRHIAALEDDLGVRLFERSARGLELTDSGAQMLEQARLMQENAHQLSLLASGHSQKIAGTIRITASQIVAAYVLPPILTRLRLSEPEIEIELVASDQTGNLLQREADIAIRMYRPTQSDVFTRKVGDLQIGMFAANTYIARRGLPEHLDDFADHDIIGYDRSDMVIRGFRAAGLVLHRHSFPIRCDDQVVCWRLVLAGYGIGFNQTHIGRSEPMVRQILPAQTLPSLPIWLTAHSELKTSLRLRRVYDYLATQLRAI